MKHIFIITAILFLSVNVSCLNSKKAMRYCTTEYFKFYNYTNKTAINSIKDISDLKQIDNNLLKSYLQNGVNLQKISQNKIVSLSRSEFFTAPNLKGNILVYVLGYCQNNNIKQYLLLESDLKENSSLYIINEIRNEMSSMFLAYSNYNNGFGSESVETKKLSDSDFQIKVYYTSDTNGIKRESSGTCNYILRLSDDGYLTLVNEKIIKKRNTK